MAAPSANERAELSKQLRQAVRDNNGKAIEQLVAAGADVNEKGGDGLTPLHIALQRHSNSGNSVPIIMALNKNNQLNPNIADNNEQTGMHYAYLNSFSDPSRNPAVRVLSRLQPPGNPDVRDNNGKTPMDLYNEQNAKLAAISKPTTPPAPARGRAVRPIENAPEPEYKTLHEAVQSGGYEAVSAFISKHPNVDVNAVDQQGNTPLHLAVQPKFHNRGVSAGLIHALTEASMPLEVNKLDGAGKTPRECLGEVPDNDRTLRTLNAVASQANAVASQAQAQTQFGPPKASLLQRVKHYIDTRTQADDRLIPITIMGMNFSKEEKLEAARKLQDAVSTAKTPADLGKALNRIPKKFQPLYENGELQGVYREIRAAAATRNPQLGNAAGPDPAAANVVKSRG